MAVSRSSQFWLNVQMVRTSQAKYIAPAVHAFLFIAMWTLYTANQGVGLLLAILLIIDLPFSIVAWGAMFQGGRDGTVVIVWGIGCTLWWHLLGRGIDALVAPAD